MKEQPVGDKDNDGNDEEEGDMGDKDSDGDGEEGGDIADKDSDGDGEEERKLIIVLTRPTFALHATTRARPCDRRQRRE